MKILGIDPGTATVGYGLIETHKRDLVFKECGVIETHKKLPMVERLHEIGTDIGALIKEMKPDLCVVEQLFFLKNVTNGMSVAQARGVILYEIAKANVSFMEFTPLQMKQLVTGHGRAEKKKVGMMITAMLKLDKIPKPDDAADALGLAICGYLSMRHRSSSPKGPFGAKF